MNPLNPYAAAKAGGELACPAYVNCFGMRIIISHGTNFFGPEQDDEKFIPLAVGHIQAGKPVPVHTVRGKPCSRYYTYVENACSAIVHLLGHGEFLQPDDVTRGRYNITGEIDVSNVDLVEMIGRMLNREPVLRYIENPPSRIRPDLSYRVSGSALAATGWKPAVTFEEGLRRTVEALVPRPDSQSSNGVVDSPPANDTRSSEHGRTG